MLLENWSIVNINDNPYDPSEMIIQALHGIVYGHYNFQDGSHITTSRIKAYKNGKIVTVSGSEYDLGEIDPEYEALYPNARDRLIKSLL
jgi:hypothetical protein